MLHYVSSLQTIIVEVKAMLNDHPLTYLPSDITDLEPLTPAHLIYGRRITTLPHPIVEEDEVIDPNYGDGSDLRKRANTQALILKHFWKRWKLEYLTSLREFHKTTGNNTQRVQTGDVVLVHDDTPRINWQLAVIEDVIKGSDGLVRAINIHTKSERTNCPIAHLYPLQVCSADTLMRTPMTTVNSQLSDKALEEQVQLSSRPTRNSAVRAHEKCLEWSEILRAPRRMSRTDATMT